MLVLCFLIKKVVKELQEKYMNSNGLVKVPKGNDDDGE